MKGIKSFLETRKDRILILAGVGTLFYIFILDPTWDLKVLVLVGLWILSVCLYRLKGEVSVVGGLIFLTLCPFLLIFRKGAMAEKSAIWAYIFLVVGVGQIFIEYSREKRKSAKKEK